jgi:lipopolysaccharide export LptBFGC system permease protein LptF
LSAGYVSLAKVLLIAIAGDLRAGGAAWDHEESVRARRGVWLAAGITIAATILLELPFFAMADSDAGPGGHMRMALYLTPSALPLSLPLGLAVASGWILHGRARTRKVATAALLASLLTSAAMFVNIGWVAPDANQAFREAAWAQSHPNWPPPVRGDGELRLGELRARLEQARGAGQVDDVRHLEMLYHQKLSVSVMPFTIVVLMVALAFSRTWTRAGLTATACIAFAASYTLFTYAFPLVERGVAPPMVLEWAANALFATVAGALTWRRRPA